jgi:hypothetical protein
MAVTITSLPELVLTEIISLVSDQLTLANLALTCKTLCDVVSSRRYCSFPVSSDAVGNVSMKTLREKLQRITALSARNFRFIRHVIIDPVTNVDPTPEIIRSLANCGQVHSLTLYIARGAIFLPSYLDRMLCSGITTLTM